MKRNTIPRIKCPQKLYPKIKFISGDSSNIVCRKFWRKALVQSRGCAPYIIPLGGCILGIR